MTTENVFETNEPGGPPNSPIQSFDLPSGRVCIPNINAAERRKRLIAGIIPFVLGLVILSALLAFGAARAWRLALMPFFWAATAGFYQWRDHT
jgi:hypothetical protein